MLTAGASASLTASSAGSCALLRRIQLFPRVLDVGDRRDLDIGDLAADLLGPPDIDVLDDIAGRGVDADRAARAVRVLPLFEKGHRLVGGKLALGRLDQVEDRRHAVPRVDGKKIRLQLVAVFLAPGGEKSVVGRPLAGGRVDAGSDNPKRGIA